MNQCIENIELTICWHSNFSTVDINIFDKFLILKLFSLSWLKLELNIG